MESLNEVIKANLMEIFRNYSSKDKGADNKLLICLLCLFLIVGSEAVIILLRKNIGGKALSTLGTIISILCFWLMGAMLIMNYADVDYSDDFGSASSCLVSGIFLILIGVLVSGRAIMHAVNARSMYDITGYEGTSQLLSFLSANPKRQKLIQYAAEPLLFLLAGTLLGFYNLFAGLAIAFCGLSLWGRYIVKAYYNITEYPPRGGSGYASRAIR